MISLPEEKINLSPPSAFYLFTASGGWSAAAGGLCGKLASLGKGYSLRLMMRKHEIALKKDIELLGLPKFSDEVSMSFAPQVAQIPI